MRSPYEEVLEVAAARARAYLDQVPERRVSPLPESIAAVSRLGGPVPEEGEEPAAVIRLLDELGSPSTVTTTGGRFFGFVIGGALPVSVAANWIAAAWDQNAGLYSASPVGAELEEIVTTWLLDLLQLPAGAAAAFVTGAQMANFTCLAAARHAVLKQAGWDVEADGLFGAPPIDVIVSDEVHVTALKALAMLGLGRNRVIRVPVDSQGRMRADALPKLHGPTIVLTQAGNVNTGAFDPIADICGVAHEHGAWVHVDGAFGLWAAAAPSRRHQVNGADQADSWATDAHKWLNVPQDSGVAFVREPLHLRAAMAITAAYLNPQPRREPMQYGPESSRRARAVEIWAALKCLGRTGVSDLIERTCKHATRFAGALRAAGYEILNDVQLNQVLVSFGDSTKTDAVIRAIQEDGTCWCGGTDWQGRRAMRISVASWATTEADVDRSLEAMLRIAAAHA